MILSLIGRNHLSSVAQAWAVASIDKRFAGLYTLWQYSLSFSQH